MTMLLEYPLTTHYQQFVCYKDYNKDGGPATYHVSYMLQEHCLLGLVSPPAQQMIDVHVGCEHSVLLSQGLVGPQQKPHTVWKMYHTGHYVVWDDQNPAHSLLGIPLACWL